MPPTTCPLYGFYFTTADSQGRSINKSPDSPLSSTMFIQSTNANTASGGSTASIV